MTLIKKLGKEFVITTELGPVKGIHTNESLEKAEKYLPLDGINIHDCPMGNLRINATMMGALVQNRLNTEAIPHFTCRDRSLLGTQADLLGAHAMGIRHILVTTGDPPKHGPFGETSKAVYNLNTFELIRLVKKLNAGLDYNDKEYGGQTQFNISCTAVPTSKDMDREISRMEKKIEAGADFFQTQVVYDAQKAVRFAEKSKSLGKPVIMGIMPLKSLKMASYMKDHVEGIDIPDNIIDKMKDGMDGIEISCEIVKQVFPYYDGIHIMAMGNISGTNAIIEYVNTLTK
ncbi:MAG: methylenetetrahydrofolate reductase [Desulfamplus sp.]|nr:methylenetetrahydrofolate reductase [Desulfamplus sp.]MBF0257681.1 methylenetetrahydrofolate reductase [Desulfamplus sp.]